MILLSTCIVAVLLLKLYTISNCHICHTIFMTPPPKAAPPHFIPPYGINNEQSRITNYSVFR